MKNFQLSLLLFTCLQAPLNIAAENSTEPTPAATATQLPFEVFNIEKKSYPQYQTFDATVEAVRRATVSSETSGRVSEINFDVGDFVEKGSVLVRMTAAATRARLSGVEANVSKMQAQYDVALSEFNRIKGVYDRQLVSKSVYDKAEAELKAATERLSAARAKVKEVLEQLKFTVIKAPYSGIVAERHIELGEMVKVGQPLMTGFSQNELRIVTHIPQSVAETIREAKSARILVNDKLEDDLHSNLITVYPDASTSTHTYKVRVKLPTTPKGIYPGHSVKVQFPTGTKTSIRVPEKSVLLRSELQAVYVVSDSRVSLRQVRIGNRDENGLIEVLAGLNDGDMISLDPVSAGVYLKSQK
ncbi:efflux RND transporter periplasmic adaptor subunit [Kaarinaea lacus]